MRNISSPLDGFSSPFGARRLGGVSPFTPAALFAGGGEGWLADALDLDTLFEDVGGTTPVDAANDPVGLRLDKSKGLELGPELVTNGDFATDLTGWTNSNWEWFDGSARTTGAFGRLTQVIGNRSVDKRVVIDFIDTSGRVQLQLVDSTSENGTIALAGQVDLSSIGVSPISALAPAGYDTVRFVTTDSDAAYRILDISIKALPGNHATQATTTFKPKSQTAGLTYDGSDDRLVSTLSPTASGSIAARFNGSTASRVIAGSQPASDGRCFLALDASGKLAAGIGAQSTSTITGGADIRSEDHVGVVTWDGSTVKLYLDGTEIYSAAQSGAVNTTVPIYEGALNANGTASAFWTGSISDSLIIDRVLTPTETTDLTNSWSS